MSNFKVYAERLVPSEIRTLANTLPILSFYQLADLEACYEDAARAVLDDENLADVVGSLCAMKATVRAEMERRFIMRN